ncbi:MAG: allantoicase [Polaribacter sp.]|jgi:allantoicase
MNQFIPSHIIAYSDSAFTNPHELVLPDEPKDYTANFTHMGVAYWGLETRRHIATSIDPQNKKILYQHHAHHWLNIGFEKRALVENVSVSTKWFTGNQIRAISVVLIDEYTNEEKEVLTRVNLAPDQEHEFSFSPTNATKAHIKLYYEGGIARINFFGSFTEEQLPEKVNILEKATISHVSNEHYGNPFMAVKGSRKEMHMVGWESARTGFGEQAIFHLEAPKKIEKVIVDTYLHRLNPPLTCHIFGLMASDKNDIETALADLPKWTIKFADGITVNPPNFQSYMLNQEYLKEEVADATAFEILLHRPAGNKWQAVLPFESLERDTYHSFTGFENSGPFSHLLYMHYPNGGIHGLKVFSTI